MNRPNWIFDESRSVGVDYFDKNLVDQYDHEHEKFRNFDEEVAKISQALWLSKESTILDIGCGTGSLTTRFSNICKHVYAADSSEAMVKVLKSKMEKQNISNITAIQAGLLSYEHSGEKLDAIVSNICLHHLPDFWKQIALNRLNAMLKPGGKFFLCDVVFDFDPTEYIENIDSWINGMRANAGDKMANETIVHVKDEFSTWDWIVSGMLEKANFSINNNSEIMKNIRIYICTKS
ncbi:MAG: class I SAM-dependent methyltransferase [Thermodesulfobacteriota bacterium]|nr:class I SAM-dependent methyltransferase [Thermodesulfobacteriota bacterium]